MTKIKSLSIVCIQGTKTYQVGQTYNGLVLDSINDKTIYYPENAVIIYNGTTKDGELVFEAINAPIEVEYTIKLLFREHRGGFEESMETVKEILSKKDLIHTISTLFPQITVTEENLKIHKNNSSVLDTRNGWDTYIVSIDSFGVVGFLNGKF